MVTPLLATKLYIPTIRRNLVPRPRLLERLDEGQHGKLMLVSAPAGFGKTTLLSEWLAQCRCPAAWLSLDTGDNDPRRFLSYLIAALQTIAPGLGEAAVTQIRTPQPILIDSLLMLLVNELCTLTRHCVLVLDDYHTIDSASVHSAVAFLLDHMPPQLHVVIATRADPPLPLSRWRSRGQMVEVRVEDLRFTLEEATTFFAEVMGLDLAEEHVARLEERTEGWIVGLQMAALSLQGREDIPAVVEAFSGTHRFVLDYLVEEVMTRQPEEVQTFLLQTSILERLSGPLCDAVRFGGADTLSNSAVPTERFDEAGTGSGRTDGQVLLEHLERANLFLVPLDDERHWYRYHHLFGELLRARLRQSVGEQGLATLQGRASLWCEEHDMMVDALGYAVAARDYERAANLVETGYQRVIARGDYHSLSMWLARLPLDALRHRPTLCLNGALALSWEGKLDEATRLVDLAEANLPEDESSPQVRTLQGLVAYIRGRIAGIHGDLGRAIELAQRAHDLVPVENQFLQASIGILLGYTYYLAGDLVRGIEILEDTIRTSRTVGSINVAVASLCVLSRVREMQGQLCVAENLYDSARQLLEDQGKHLLGPTGIVEAGMGGLLAERNDLLAARQHLEQALDHLQLWSKPDDLSMAYAAWARILRAWGNLPEATEALERAEQLLAMQGVFPEAESVVQAARVRLWLTQGDLVQAARWAQSQRGQVGTPDLWQELEYLALARVLLAQGQQEDASSLLVRLAETAEAEGRNGRLIEILTLQAMALQAQNRMADAVTVLGRALSLAQPEGYMRVFLDEGAPMAELLRQAATRGIAPGYVQALLEAGETDEATSQSSIVQPLVEPLSERELEVLGLIVSGLSNAEIARELVITVGTTKWHITNIYGKLQVRSRAQAIKRAHQLKLV